MSSKPQLPNLKELKPRITVIGVGGAGGNAINNMIASGIDGVEFVAANTDAQALISSSAERRIQLGVQLTEGLGAGAKPEIGEAAAEEAIDEIRAVIEGSHMVFIAAGMGGGTGTGAASVVAKASREMGILTVAIVTKPFNFEGNKRLRTAERGIEELRHNVDTLIVIPNQNLFRIANERTTFAEAFLLADQVLHSGIACITDLIVREGLINLDFADVRAVMSGMGTAMMGTGEASGARRAVEAAELAILNPLLDDVSLRGAQGLLVSISGSRSLTLYEVDEAASRVRAEVDPDANIIIGATFDESLSEKIRVSIVASGLQGMAVAAPRPAKASTASPRRAEPVPQLQPMPTVAEWGRGRNSAAQTEFAQQDASERAADEEWQSQPSYQDQAAYEDQGAAAEQVSQPVWTGPGDVVIELGPPQHGDEPAWPASDGDFNATADLAPEFRPMPPVEARRPPRRLPEVEDFPQFAQHAYRSKRAEAAAPAPAPTPPPEPERKRGGLFTFLTGRKDVTPSGSESAFEPRLPQRDPRDQAGADGSFAPLDANEGQRQLPIPRHRPRQS